MALGVATRILTFCSNSSALVAPSVVKLRAVERETSTYSNGISLSLSLSLSLSGSTAVGQLAQEELVVAVK